MVALWNDIACPPPPLSQSQTRQEGLKLAGSLRVKVTGITLKMATSLMAGDPGHSAAGTRFLIFGTLLAGGFTTGWFAVGASWI